MNKSLVILVCLGLAVDAVAFAETIILKSGKKVEGKIIERTDKYIKIDLDDIPITYYLDEIESIDKGKTFLQNSGNIKNDNTKKGLKDKCEIYTKENMGLENGEQIVACPDAITYSHTLYKFAIMLPPNWNQIYINERKPDELGKITSIAFGPKDTKLTMFHIVMKKSKNINLEDELKEYMDSKKETEGFIFVLQSGPTTVNIKNYDAIKLVYSSNFSAKVITSIILKDGISYELNFASETLDDYDKYSSNFEEILGNIIIGTEIYIHPVKDEEEFTLAHYKEIAEKYNGPNEVVLKVGIKFRPDDIAIEDGNIWLMFKGDKEKAEYDYEDSLVIPLIEVESVNKLSVDQAEVELRTKSRTGQ